MNIGTRSLLFGAHQFILHPIWLFVAWWRLYGFPWDSRLWLAFVIHDIGYWGKPNMDGPEGESHVDFGARVMGKLFGYPWYCFMRYHSRFWARNNNQHISQLCVADKYVIAMMPGWYYIPMVTWTGEIDEFMHIQKHKDDLGVQEPEKLSKQEWFETLQSNMDRFVILNKDTAYHWSMYAEEGEL